MAETTPTPTPTPATKPKHPRSTINRAHLDEIKNSRTVATAAADAANTAGLATVDFDATLPVQITTLAGKIETAIGKLTGTRAAKTELTAQETTARTALMAVIAPIQTAAKRKYTGDQKELLHAYFVGEPLAHDTLQEVQTAAIAIRDRLVAVPPSATPLDVLPGIKAVPQIKALTDAIALYATDQTTQDDQENKNSKALEAIVADIGTLAGLRHQVQLAAEQAWPWRNPGVASLRTTFLLPTDRPLPG